MLGNREARDGFVQWLKGWTPQGRRWALLLGPPGTGKTSLVYSCAEREGMQVFEINRENWGRGTSLAEADEASKTVASLSGSNVRRIVLVDEVDTFTSTMRGEGLGDLFEVLENTRVPVVFTMDDQDALYSSKKLYPLRSSSCVQFKFGRIRKDVIQAALKRICAREGVAPEPEALSSIASSAQGDMRYAINVLQAACMGSTALKEADIEPFVQKTSESYMYKTVLDVLSAPSTYTARSVLDESGVDQETLFRWLVENIPAYDKPLSDRVESFDTLAAASVFNHRAERFLLYDLKKYFLDLMCYAPQVLGQRPFIRLAFPASLKLRGSSYAARRTSDTLGVTLGRRVHLSKERAVREVIPFLAIMCQGNPSYSEWVSRELGSDVAQALLAWRPSGDS
ncbi:MAG: AAA family ATPase [Thermoprotei archaeon]